MRTTNVSSWLLMLVAGMSLRCSGSSKGPNDDPKPVDVPIGLTVQCEKALDGGSLVVDAAFHDATVASDTCLLYRVGAGAAETLLVQAMVESGGVDLLVARDADFQQLETGSVTFGSNDHAAKIIATSATTYHVALIGKDTSSLVAIRVRRAVATPAGVGDCSITLDGGELLPGAPGREELIIDDSCVRYTFEGVSDTVFRLKLVSVDERPEELLVAADSAFSNIVSSASFLDASATLYAITAETQPYYVIVRGDLFSTVRYDITLEQGTTPIGLATACFMAQEKGALALDGTATTAALAERSCDLFTFSGAQDLLYFVSLQGGSQLRIARDEAFLDDVTTDLQTIEGRSGRAFVADQTSTFHVAVVNAGETTATYDILAHEALPPPTELDHQCNRSSGRGALVVDAPPSAQTVKSSECAHYVMSVASGTTYSIQAVPSSGHLSLYVSADNNYATPIASSTNGSGAQGLSFTASLTGEVHITVAGGADTAFTLWAVTSATRPTGLSGDCQYAIDAGALTVGGASVSGFAASSHCTLYSFAGTSSQTYTIELTALQGDNPDMKLSANTGFSPLLATAATSGGDSIVFIAGGTQTFYIAVHGFQAAEYTIAVAASPPPPANLSTYCDAVRDAGSLGIGAPSVNDTAVANQCVVFSFSGAAGIHYTVTMYTSGGDPGLVVASNATFGTILTAQENAGGETYGFTASGTQTYYLAVFPSTTTATNFEVFVTSP